MVTVALLSEFPEPCWLPIEKSGVLVVVVVVEGVVLHVTGHWYHLVSRH